MRMFVFFLVMTLYECVGRYHRFGETFCLHLQGWRCSMLVSTYKITWRHNTEDQHLQEIPFLWHPKIHHHETLLLDSTLNQMNPVHISTACFFNRCFDTVLFSYTLDFHESFQPVQFVSSSDLKWTTLFWLLKYYETKEGALSDPDNPSSCTQCTCINLRLTICSFWSSNSNNNVGLFLTE
jgi:hypothetical protein